MPAASIEAVVLSHAHVDHSGRLPLLTHEREAEWENRRRQRRGAPSIAPLYTQAEND